MNRETLKKLLGDSATDEVIDSIMSANGKDVNRAKGDLDALQSRLNEANQTIEGLRADADANLTNEQKFQKQLEEANKRAAEAERSRNEMSAVAVFAGAGLTEDEYKPFLGSIAGGSMDEAVNAAKAIADVVGAHAKAAADAQKKASLGEMRAPAGGETGATVTSKKQFDALSAEEQIRFVHENPGVLSTLK